MICRKCEGTGRRTIRNKRSSTMRIGVCKACRGTGVIRARRKRVKRVG